jgi:hypothetical protein
MIDLGDLPTWCLVILGGIGGGAALRQLSLQRVQLADQRQQLRDQQDVISRQIRLQEREQANQVDVTPSAMDGALATVLPKGQGELVHMIRVFNQSARPIRRVACQIEAIQADPKIRHTKLADVYGQLVPVGIGSRRTYEHFVLRERFDTMPVLKAGEIAAFVWDFTKALYPRIELWLRFTDDAGLDWEVTTDYHLAKLESRDDW